MTPTLFGRIQTRIFVLLTVGVLTTAVVSLFVPADVAPGSSRGDALGGIYAITFSALAIVLVVGVLAWEPLYHLLQQFRWEKDWPTMFGLLTGINEGLVTYLLLRAIGPSPDNVKVGLGGFIVDFTLVWLAAFLFVNGPIRVLFIRWRFRGGRIV